MLYHKCPQIASNERAKIQFSTLSPVSPKRHRSNVWH